MRTPQWRAELRDQKLRNAMAKRAAGVPTYTVPEAAALLSVSSEHLYRLIHADAFPAVHMTLGGNNGRYVVPAATVERLLGQTDASGNCVDIAEWTVTHRNQGA